MLRIWLKRRGSVRATKKLLLVAPPYITVGESIHHDGKDWIVARTQEAGEGIEVKFPRSAAGKG